MERVNLSAGEWRVMEELWKAPATLMELVRALGESAGWAKSTVSTVVRRMEDKGLIRAEQEGRAKVFYPAIAREEPCCGWCCGGKSVSGYSMPCGCWWQSGCWCR